MPFRTFDHSKLKRKRRRKKKTSFMNIAVVFVLMTVLAFTIVWTVGFFQTTSEPATLITCFFAFMGVEGGCMAWIKNVKTKESTKEEKKKIEEEQAELEDNVAGIEDEPEG